MAPPLSLFVLCPPHPPKAEKVEAKVLTKVGLTSHYYPHSSDQLSIAQYNAQWSDDVHTTGNCLLHIPKNHPLGNSFSSIRKSGATRVYRTPACPEGIPLLSLWYEYETPIPGLINFILKITL